MAKYMSVTQIISVSIFLKDQVVVRMDSVSRDPVLVVPVLAAPVVITSHQPLHELAGVTAGDSVVGQMMN